MGKMMKNGISYGGVADIDLDEEDVVLTKGLMPSTPRDGMSVLYVGDTNTDYTYGHVYVYKNVSGTMKWVDTTEISGEVDVLQKDLSASATSHIGLTTLITNALTATGVSFEGGKSYVGKMELEEPSATSKYESGNAGSEGTVVGTYCLTVDEGDTSAEQTIHGSINLKQTRTTTYSGDTYTDTGTFLFNIVRKDDVWSITRIYASPIEHDMSFITFFMIGRVWKDFDRDILLTINSTSWSLANQFGLNNRVLLKFSRLLERTVVGSNDKFYEPVFTCGNCQIIITNSSMSLTKFGSENIVMQCMDFIDAFNGNSGDIFSSCQIAYAVPGITLSSNFPNSNIPFSNPYVLILSNEGHIPNELGITGYSGEYPAILLCDLVTGQCKFALSKERYMEESDDNWYNERDGLGNFIAKGFVIRNPRIMI